MARVTIDNKGTKRYLNDSGYIMRDDGPAIIWADGHKMWRNTNYIPNSLIEMTHYGEAIFTSAQKGEVATWIEHPSGYKQCNEWGRISWPKF